MYRRYRRKPKGKISKVTKRYVKRVLDNAREDKYIDLSQTIALNTAATDNAGSIVLLSGCSQGTTFGTRVGETISAKFLEFRLDCYPNGAQTNATNLRIIVFQDRQIRTSTLPTVSDVLETVTYNSPINHVAINAKRFRILFDKDFELDPWASGSGVSTTQSFQQIKKRYKLGTRIVYSNSSTGTQRNNVYVLYISDKATAAAPAVNMYSRITFEDA